MVSEVLQSTLEERSVAKQTRSDRWVNGVIGDSPQRGLQRAFHKWSQQEKGLQIVTDGALGAAVMFYRAAAQQTRLEEQHRSWKREMSGSTFAA